MKNRFALPDTSNAGLLIKSFERIMKSSPEAFCDDLAKSKLSRTSRIKYPLNKLPYYEEAKRSESEARRWLFRSFPDLPNPQDSFFDPNEGREKLLAFIKAGVPLSIFNHEIESMAAINDEQFFVELGEVLENDKAKFRKLEINDLNVHLASCWTTHALWLMTDFAASLYFQRGLNLDVTDAAYTKARQRLKLKQHPKLQPIDGYSPKSGPIFRCGNLDTFLKMLSR